LAITLLAITPAAARSTTLQDAILLAYQTNPSLRAERAHLRAIDEGYVQARAGFGPQIGFTGQGAYQGARVQQGASLFSGPSDVNYRGGSGSGDLSIVQPLYTAGANRAQALGAKADVLAGRQDLRQTESQLILNVITAYLDVRRDREVTRILRDEITNLEREFEETKAKGDLGQLTRTDVAESEPRLLSARAQLNLAEGRLKASNAEYLNAVGTNPDNLDPEPTLPGMPATLDQAFDAAEHNNPKLLEAIDSEQSAREKVNQVKASFGPTISLKVDASASPVLPYLPQYDRSVTAAVVVNQQIFNSGLNSSRVREAVARDTEARLTVEATRRSVVQAVSQAWSELVSTRCAVAIEARQVAVERVAVEGNEVEERVGLRTTIELLNAELELANSRIEDVQSRHDEYIASATLLSAMGVLEAGYLAPEAEIYDPRTPLKKVERIGAPPWEGLIEGIDGIGAPRSTPALPGPGPGAERPVDLASPTTPDHGG